MDDPFDAETVDMIAKASAMTYLTGGDAMADIGIEPMNYLSAYLHAIGKDSAGKTWFYAKRHPAIARALRVDPRDAGAIYALAPFKLHVGEDGKAAILVAYPALRELEPASADWLGIETVLAWNPKTGTVSVMGDASPQLVGAFTDPAHGTVFADPFAFFRAWIEARAAFYVRRQIAQASEWMAQPIERDAVPGVLMVGAPEQIRWSPATMPQAIACVGVDPKTINRAILKAASLPRVFQAMKVAA